VKRSEATIAAERFMCTSGTLESYAYLGTDLSLSPKKEEGPEGPPRKPEKRT
jgi:hypothetical protein